MAHSEMWGEGRQAGGAVCRGHHGDAIGFLADSKNQRFD